MTGDQDLQVQTNQQEFSFMQEPLFVPVSKLDAEQYVAEDIDGATESVFGAGNLGYASLQAAQMDGRFSKTDEFDSKPSESGHAVKNADVSNQVIDTAESVEYETSLDTVNISTSDISSQNFQNGEHINFDGNYLGNAALGSVKVSELSSNTGIFSAPGSGLSLSDGLKSSSSSGKDGKDGYDGKSPDDQEHCHDDYDKIEINNTFIDLDLGDVSYLLNQTFLGLNQTLETLDIDIESILNSVLDVVQNISSESLVSALDILQNISQDLVILIQQTIPEITNVTESLFETINNLSENTVSQVLELSLEKVETLIGDLESVDLVGDKLAEVNGSIEKLESVLLDIKQTVFELDVESQLVEAKESLIETVETTLNIVSQTDGLITQVVDNVFDLLGTENLFGGDSDDTDLDLGLDVLGAGEEVLTDAVDVVLDPVEDLVGDIDLVSDINLDLLNSDDSASDSDLNIESDLDLLDNDIIDLAEELELDPIEEVTGDIDLNLDLSTDLLGDSADNLIDNENGGSTEDTLLSDVGDTLSETVETVLPDLNSDEPSDQDLNLDADLDIANLENQSDVDVNLDTIEDLTQDIDLGIDIDVTDLINLQDFSDDVSDTGESLVNWTETSISGDSDSILGQSDDTHTDSILPEPIGTVSEGMGSLDVNPELDAGNLGGLFG